MSRVSRPFRPLFLGLCHWDHWSDRSVHHQLLSCGLQILSKQDGEARLVDR